MANNIMSFEEWRKSQKSNTNSTTSTFLNLNPTFEEFRSNREKYNELTKKNNAIIEERNNTTQVEPIQSREEETSNSLLSKLAYANPVYSLFKLPENAKKAVEAGKNFFSQSFFKEGEGNVLQNIGGTIADTGINVTKGLLNYAEDIADFGVYKIADLAELVGQNNKAESMRKYADVRAVNALFGENELNTENINFKYLPEAVMTGKIENEVVPDETLVQKIDKYSYLDKGMDDVAQGVGQLLGTIGTSELIGKTGLTKGFEKTLTKHGVDAKVAQDYAKSLNTALSSYSSAYGGTYGNMRRLGYSDEEAKKQARISGFVEAISEQLHDGIPGTKTAGWADKILKSDNPTLKALFNSIGEVDEEVFGNILTTVINDIRFNLDPDNPYLQDNNLYSGDILKDIYDNTLSDDAKSEYLTVFLSSLITNGASTVGQKMQERSQQNPLLKSENLNQGQPIEQVKSQPETKVEQKVQNVPQVAVQNESENISELEPEDVDTLELDRLNKQREEQTIEENKTVVENEIDEEAKKAKKTLSELDSRIDNIKPYTQNDIERLSSDKNIVTNSKSRVVSFIKDIFNKYTSGNKENRDFKLFLGRINDDTANKVTLLINNSKRFEKKYDLKDYNITLGSSNINHIIKDHLRELRKGQIPVDIEKLSHYDEVIATPDYIGLSDNNAKGNNPMVYFTKKINGYSVAVEAITKNKQMYPETYYVFESNSKEYNDFIKNRRLKKAESVDLGEQSSSKLDVQDDTLVASYDSTLPQNSGQVKQSQDDTRQSANETIPQDTLSIALKERKFYDSVIKSENTTEQAKKISKKLTGEDMYAPDSNNAELSRADEYINEHGIEDSLKMLREVTESSRNNVDDVAIGNRLIEYFSKTGDEQGLEEAIQLTAMAGTNVGRAVQAMSLIGRQTPAGQATWIERCVNKLNKQMEEQFSKSHSPFKKKQEFKFTTEMKQKIINSTEANLEQNINEVYQELGSQVQMSLLEAIDSWRYFSMLSSPTTHLRNIIGNLTMGGIQGIKDKIAGGIEDLYYGISGKQGERTKTFGKANKEYFNFATEDLKNDVVKTKLGYGSNKYTNPKSQLEQNKRMFSDTKVGRFLEKTIKKGAIDTTSKLLEQEDIGSIKIKGQEYNITGLSRNYINSMAQYLYANKIDLKNITQQQLNQARAYAIEAAKQATFHQESALATLLTTFENKNLATKVIVGGIVPFKKTPFNVAKTALSYNPVGLLKTITYDSVQLYNGKINANQYIDNLAKGLTGTGIAVVGYVLASMGLIRTSGKDDEQYESDKGVQPYSFSIGDKTITLDWLSPTAVPLFVGAELYNQVNNMNNDLPENEKDQVVRNGFLNLLNAGVSSLNPVSEMTMLSGIQSALKTYSGDYSKALEEIGTNTIKTYVNQLTPSLLGKIAKSTDEYERSTTSTSKTTVGKTIDTIVNQTKSKIPGLRQTLPKKTDVWGNEVKQNENPLLRTTYNLLSPATVKDVRETELDKEISRLYESTGEKSVLPKTYIDKYFTYNNKEYRLTQDEYAAYKQTLGKNNYEILSNLIKSSDYKKLNDEEKAKLISQVYTYDKNVNKEAYAKINKINYTPDSTYYAQKKSTMLGGTIDDYLIYKLQDFKADKDEEGNSISGTKKVKVVDYLNDVDMDYNQKLYLFAKDYALSPQEKTYIAELINTSNLSVEDKLALYKDLTGFKVGSDGTVRW